RQHIIQFFSFSHSTICAPLHFNPPHRRNTRCNWLKGYGNYLSPCSTHLNRLYPNSIARLYVALVRKKLKLPSATLSAYCVSSTRSFRIIRQRVVATPETHSTKSDSTLKVSPHRSLLRSHGRVTRFRHVGDDQQQSAELGQAVESPRQRYDSTGASREISR